jgi:NAD(P)-dependent dehydrogenase (short-subunit alcohol dehydrogenase family)
VVQNDASERCTIVVTGANSGIGLGTTRRLFRAGHHVVMACRSIERAERAAAAIRTETVGSRGEGSLEIARLDVADPESIRDFAASWSADRTLDVLVNNAGVMALDRSSNSVGWEMQFGTNHLGHFALTGLLLPALARSPSPRVVTVSSLGHRVGRLDLDDVMFERRRYQRWGAYFQSKLANVMFARECDRRAKASDHPLRSVGCHPGTASTEIGKTGTSLTNRVIRTLFPVLARSAERGAAAVEHACLTSVAGGEFFGPRWLMFGTTRSETPSRRARDDEAARRLWEWSEETTGVRFEW